MTRMSCFGRRYSGAGLAVTVMLFLSLILLPATVGALEVGDKAPDFQAVTITGKHISYDRDLKGRKPVYLIFWATW
jgi:hypothetical protein